MIAGAGVVIPVLANDMAASGGTLQIIAVSMPEHGAINVLPDQTIRYMPQGGFHRYLTETNAGVANVVYAAVGSTNGEAVTFSRADLQTTERQLIHARWQSSDAASI